MRWVVHVSVDGDRRARESKGAAGAASGNEGSPTASAERHDAIRRRTIEQRGYWNPTWDAILETDPDFMEAYVAFSGVPWAHGHLSPKVKEFIYIAIDAATTHLHLPGLRNHIRAALEAGATPEEIMEVIELVSVLGIHSATMGVPILQEEVAAFEAKQPGAGPERE